MVAGVAPATMAAAAWHGRASPRRTRARGRGQRGLGGRRTHPEDVSVLGEVGGGPTAAESSAAELGWPRGKTDGGDDSLRSGTIPSAWRSSTARRSLWRSRLGSGRPETTASSTMVSGGRGHDLWLGLGFPGAGKSERGRERGPRLAFIPRAGAAWRQWRSGSSATVASGRGRYSVKTMTLFQKPPCCTFPFLFLFSNETAASFYLFGASNHFQNLWKYSWRLRIR